MKVQVEAETLSDIQDALTQLYALERTLPENQHVKRAILDLAQAEGRFQCSPPDSRSSAVFRYRGPDSRCQLGERELHCGDTFEIQDERGQWHHTRIEHTVSLDCRWYLVGVPTPRAVNWDGCTARREA